MKRFYALALAVLFYGSIMAQPVIKFEKNIHNFGQFDKKKIQTYEFIFTNTGDEPLVIHQAYGSCGCTVPQFSTEPIQPGKKGTIKVTFNGKSQFNGKFKKSVSVRSNASNSLARVYIEGIITEKE